MGNAGYAVVSCHVERPLEDEVWKRFEALQKRRPGGFSVAALMRPPDAGGGEHAQEERWLERARGAATRAPFGLHTHWTAPNHARPSSGRPAKRVADELAWLRERGLRPALFCGGGWYGDGDVAHVLAEAGIVDCTPTSFRPKYLPLDAPRLELAEPAQVVLLDRIELTALPTTRSIGMLARALAHPRALSEPVVHAYFHDTDLLDGRRRRILSIALALLARRRAPLDHLALINRLAPLPQIALEDCLRP